jgi:uncharacterized metal-binding protein YceD (DUF177 family)
MRQHIPETRRHNRGQSPWHVPLAVEDVPETGKHVEIAADEQVRAAVARIAGLRDVPRLEASFEVTQRAAGGFHVTGRVSATVGQTCVVTLEPIVNEVEEAVDLLFVPPALAPAATEAPLRPEDAQEEEREPLIGGMIDLGAVAAEFLMLGLDPYPRKPGAIFQPPPDMAPDGGGPFAALAGLKKVRDDR